MRLLLPTLILCLSSLSVSAQEKPSEEFLFELYEYCVEEYGDLSENRDANVLLCINEDLEYNDMLKFDSLAQVKKILATRLNAKNNGGI